MKIKKCLLIAVSLFSFSMISQPAKASVSFGFFFQPMPVVYHDCCFDDPWACPCDYYYPVYPRVRRVTRYYSEYYYRPVCRRPVRHCRGHRYRVRHRRCCDVWYD